MRIPADILIKIDKLLLKFMWKFKKSRITKPPLEKKGKLLHQHRLILRDIKIL